MNCKWFDRDGKTCKEQATMKASWPGTTIKVWEVCAEHAQKTQVAALAMGFTSYLCPIDGLDVED